VHPVALGLEIAALCRDNRPRLSRRRLQLPQPGQYGLGPLGGQPAEAPGCPGLGGRRPLAIDGPGHRPDVLAGVVPVDDSARSPNCSAAAAQIQCAPSPSTTIGRSVAMAAIQELYQVVQEKDAQLAAQGQRLDTLEQQNAALEARLAALEERLVTAAIR
jgi:hypothetical protein